eukprot:CAMPEP_0204064996 /NCGR_PEP_ID=MMETSP0360-20130528/149559_1 /ASSEMBLY_ACC=CAM_ASM_000342 /TAXON_ID=268821 /ORGANISM="Scrippsiella Hangoei, Strain SHTV-5" /LENGTH=48 /DNA_ID= /DNA_START= /DNA_END= /DNA_ORIENTATION=
MSPNSSTQAPTVLSGPHANKTWLTPTTMGTKNQKASSPLSVMMVAKVR